MKDEHIEMLSIPSPLSGLRYRFFSLLDLQEFERPCSHQGLLKLCCREVRSGNDSDISNSAVSEENTGASLVLHPLEKHASVSGAPDAFSM